VAGTGGAIGDGERRARLAFRHHLARPAARVERVAGDLAGLHSSDPATVFLSAAARVRRFRNEALERALYERRSLVRILGMRRTLFVVPLELAPVIDAACTRDLAAPERRRLARMLEEQGVARDGERWIRRVSAATLEALAARGEAAATELTEDVPALRGKLTFGQGKRWAATVGLSTRILFLLAAEGRVVRTRPRGTWVSGQYRWARTEDWLPGGIPSVDPDEAAGVLARAWLGAFGPGTLADLKWWTGWTVRRTEAALAGVGAVEVGLDGGTGFALPDDLGATPAPDPWVALLPGLDPSVMGWKERAWYLGAHAEQLFDTNGNAGPTVWVDGRVVGAWAQASDGTVVVHLLERVPRAARAAIGEEAEALTARLGPVRVAWRFPSPLHRALSREGA
jgi:hypothetical protein